MPVAQKKNDNLVETKIESKVEKTPAEKDTTKKVTTKKTAEKKEKKPTFLGTTIAELRKVSWPSFGYVLSWSGVIIAFTFVMAISLGFVDHVFTGGVSFVNCTSAARQETVQNCASELGEFILEFPNS